MGVCVPNLLSCRASRNDVGTISGDVSRRVCSSCGRRASGIGESFAQACDRISDRSLRFFWRWIYFSLSKMF